MIIFSREVLLVHNPKTGGTSLLQFLSEALPGATYIAGVKELGTHHPHLEDAVAYARSVSGFDPEDEGARILAVVREPVDRERSMYVYYRNVLSVSPTLETDLPDKAMQAAVRKSEVASFEEWLEWQRTEFGHCDLWRSEFFYRSPDGDYPEALSILRFEQLDEDLSKLVKRWGWKETSLPRLNVSGGLEVNLCLSSKTEAFIHDSYRWMTALPSARFVR